MARLRAPGGCPWDREQTFDTIKPYTAGRNLRSAGRHRRARLERTGRRAGRLLLQAVFYAQMAAEEKLFDRDALDAINEKLIRRHPHVFGEQIAETAGDVRRIWGEVKAPRRKSRQGRTRAGRAAGSVPRALPALVEAQQLTVARRRHVGFDWDNAEQVLEKLHEELAEFAAARRGASRRNWKARWATCFSCW
jgi:MazG family protein